MQMQLTKLRTYQVLVMFMLLLISATIVLNSSCGPFVTKHASSLVSKI